jgi:hypothetical protein
MHLGHQAQETAPNGSNSVTSTVPSRSAHAVSLQLVQPWIVQFGKYAIAHGCLDTQPDEFPLIGRSFRTLRFRGRVMTQFMQL